MKKSILLFLLLIIAFSITNAQEEANIVPGEVILMMKKNVTSEMIKNQYSSVDMVPVRQLSKRMNIWLFRYDEAKVSRTNILENLKQNSGLKVAQFNHYIEAREAVDVDGPYTFGSSEATPNDPRFGDQWSLNNTGQSGGTPDADIDAVEAWDLHTGALSAFGDTIVVAVIDGGCDIDHEDLNLWKNRHEIPGNGVDDDNNGYIDDYDGWNSYDHNGTVPDYSHGTHVAGIAGAVANNNIGVAGVNWNVKVLPIAGSSSQEAITVESYSYVHELRSTYNETNGAQGAFIVATNASFGVDYGNPANFPIWCAIYDSLGEQGVLNCGATANLGIDVDTQGDIPTTCPSDYMVAVTNTTDTDARNSGAAYGLTHIDLGAPGTSVLSSDNGNTYSYKTGTSMATPTVAGAIGLMFAAANPSLMAAYKANPGDVALQFKQYLLDSTDPNTALNGQTVSGGRLNLYNALLAVGTEADTIAPTQVTDLNVTDSTSSSLTLAWTAPHDTTRNGVVGYDIRYSTTQIGNDTDFGNATLVDFVGVPGDSGQAETITVNGLNLGTNYFFALKSYDLWGNKSVISNLADGETYGAPHIVINPDSMGLTLNNNAVFVDTLRITNNTVGNSTLDYSIVLENNSFPEGVINTRFLGGEDTERGNYISKERPSNNKGLSVRGSGGPDAYGYKWADSDEANGPTYVWNDISTTGTELTSWATTGTFDPKDEGYATISGFNFSYYGVDYNNIYVSSNGYVTVIAPAANSFTNQSIPNADTHNGLIAPFWDDLDGTDQGNVYYQIDGDVLTIQYVNWPKYNSSNGLTYQIVIKASGKILFYYNTISGTINSATIGIENEDGTDGLLVAHNADYVANNKAVQFAADPEWLTLGNLNGTIHNGNTALIEVSFMSEDFAIGNYLMDLKVTSNDPGNTEVIVPVTMEITQVPVELTSFTANTNGNSVNLSWATATETNNSGFAIERSSDFKSFSEIAFVDGSGNSASTKSYSYSDVLEKATTSKLLYRLKQIDYDGSVNYSNTIEVNVNSLPETYSLKQNYPNPFNPSTAIEFSLPEVSNVKVVVYNVLGQMVTEIVNGVKDAGHHSVQFNASSLTSGMYIYSIEAKSTESNKSFRDLKKMILMK